MNGRRAGTVLLAAVGVGFAGCADETTDGSSSGSSEQAGSPIPVITGAALFEDTFDDDRNGWGIGDDPEFGSTDFHGGDYVWSLTGSMSHWLPEVLGAQYDSGELNMMDVVVRAEVTIVEGQGVAGVFCRENPDTDAEWQWYEFVAREGFAAIRLADAEGNIETLDETDQVDVPSGEPVTLEASCIDRADGVAQLSLSLDGSAVLSTTHDDQLGNGVSGLQAYTFPAHEQLDVRWHEFTV